MSKSALITSMAIGFILAIHVTVSCSEIVIVTLKEAKKKVTGDLVSADGDKVVVKQDDKDVELKWPDIQKVSNGLTQESAIKRWKAENADKLCAVCHGDRVVACPKCGGTGKDPTTKVVCKTCNGAGTEKCTVKSCVNGIADCPNTCLKLSEGTWELGDGGLRWRKFAMPGGGWQSWSEHHLGEVIAIVDGTPVNKGRCPQCNGTMKVKCQLCLGTGQIVCPECKGDKEVAGPCNACKDGKIPCAACNATGLKP